MNLSNILIIHDIKNEIKESIGVHDELVCSYCDQLLKLARQEQDFESMAFAYIWKADHYFYVNYNSTLMYKYLESAEKHLDLNKASELLEKFYTLFHLFYENTFDEKLSFQYRLRALEVSEELGLKSRIAAGYGSIAEFFFRYESMDETLDYFNQAINILHDEEGGERLLRLVYFNLVQVYTKQNKAKEIKRCLDIMENLEIEKEDIKIYLDCSYVSYYSVLNDERKVSFYIDEILKDGAVEFTNQLFAFDFVRIAFNAAMRISNENLAKKMLDCLDIVVGRGGVTQEVQLHRFKIQFDKEFNHHSLLKEQYKDYYVSYFASQKHTTEFKSAGMLARLKLMESQIRHNEAEKVVRNLESVANYDELTKIYNRRFLNMRQNEIVANKDHQRIGFIIFDVDYFKEYNDYYGHLEGDNVLIKVATCLRQHHTDKIDVCRYGGDEFVCLCHDLTNQQMREYINEVVESIKTENIEHLVSNSAKRITLSIGYGSTPMPLKRSVFSLFEEVDAVLYEAKRHGRNCVVERVEEELDNE